MSLSTEEYIAKMKADYAALEQENAALKARLERLSAPVSDEDVNGLAMILAMLHEDVKPPTRADIV